MNNETLDQPLAVKGNIIIKTNAVKFGIIGGFISVISSLLLYFTGLEMNDWLKWIPTLVMIAVIILGIKSIADENKNSLLSFGTLFKAGMIVSIIFIAITSIYFLIYYNFIDLSFTDKILNLTKQRMTEKGMSEDQMEKALEMTKTFISPVYMLLFSVIGGLIFGAITSLIGAAIFKKDA